MKRARKSSHAFMLLDALFGLMIVGALGLILAIAVGKQHRAQLELADLRAANRVAERVLLDLQLHQQPPVLPHANVQIHSIDGDAPKDFLWTSVQATVHGHSAILYGIVPTSGGAR